MSEFYLLSFYVADNYLSEELKIFYFVYHVLSTKAAVKIQSLLNKEVSGILTQHHYKLCVIAQGKSKTRLFIIIAIICSMTMAYSALPKAQEEINALLRVVYTVNDIQRAGQPSIRARLMSEHNFGWTHAFRILVLLGLLWQE